MRGGGLSTNSEAVSLKTGLPLHAEKYNVAFRHNMIDKVY